MISDDLYDNDEPLLMPFALYPKEAFKGSDALLDWSQADYRPGSLYVCPNCGGAVKAVQSDSSYGFEHMLSTCSFSYESSVKAGIAFLFEAEDAIRLPSLEVDVNYVSSHGISYSDSKTLELSRMEPVHVNAGINPEYHCTNPVWELEVGPFNMNLLLVIAFGEPTPSAALWEFKKHNKPALELNLQGITDLTLDSLRELLLGEGERLRWVFHPKQMQAREEMLRFLVESTERKEKQLFVPENGHLVAEGLKQQEQALQVYRETDALYLELKDKSPGQKLSYFLRNMGIPESVFLPTWLDQAVPYENCFGVSRYLWQAALCSEFLSKAKERGIPPLVDVPAIVSKLRILFGCQFEQEGADEQAVTAYLDALAPYQLVSKYGPRYYRKLQYLSSIT